jgi:hypothetical protein
MGWGGGGGVNHPILQFIQPKKQVHAFLFIWSAELSALTIPEEMSQTLLTNKKQGNLG